MIKFGKIFSPSLESKMFSLTCNGVRCLSALDVMSDMFFSAGCYFSQV